MNIELLNLKQASRFLGIEEEKVLQMITKGRISAQRQGATIKIPRSELEQMKKGPAVESGDGAAPESGKPSDQAKGQKDRSEKPQKAKLFDDLEVAGLVEEHITVKLESLSRELTTAMAATMAETAASQKGVLDRLESLAGTLASKIDSFERPSAAEPRPREGGDLEAMQVRALAERLKEAQDEIELLRVKLQRASEKAAAPEEGEPAVHRESAAREEIATLTSRLAEAREENRKLLEQAERSAGLSGEASAELNRLHRDNESLTRQLEQMKEGRQRIIENINKLKEENRRLQDGAAGRPAVTEVVRVDEEKVKLLEEQLSRLSERGREAEALGERLGREKEALAQSLGEAREEAARAQEELKRSSLGKSSVMEEIARLGVENRNLREERDAFRAALTQNEQAVGKVREELREMKHLREVAEQEMVKARQDSADMERELEGVHRRFEELMKEKQSLVVRVEKLTLERGSMQQMLGQARTDAQYLGEKAQELEKERKLLKEQVLELTDERDSLKDAEERILKERDRAKDEGTKLVKEADRLRMEMKLLNDQIKFPYKMGERDRESIKELFEKIAQMESAMAEKDKLLDTAYREKLVLREQLEQEQRERHETLQQHENEKLSWSQILAKEAREKEDLVQQLARATAKKKWL